MTINLPFISIGAIAAIGLFYYMRHDQVRRNDKKSKRLVKRKTKFAAQLKKNNPQPLN